ncbi:hypothetical protein RQP46_009647 [Phenoliferia psychrophenolica]
MTSATSAPTLYHDPIAYAEPFPETYFPPISIPPSSAPFFDATPSINPQLLFQPPPSSNPKTPTLPSIFTSFVAAPFPNGNVLVTTAHASWDEATTPTSATSLFGTHAGLFGALDARDIYAGPSDPGNVYSPGVFNGAFDTPLAFDDHHHPEGLGADLARAASPIPPSLTIAISRSETPPIIARQPSHGRSRSFGSSRPEPYPTSSSANGTDVSDAEDAYSAPSRHRRGSSASRHARSPESSLDFTNDATGLGAGRQRRSGSSHGRTPSGQSDLGVDFPLDPQSLKQSPSTGLAQLHLSPNLPSLFPAPVPASATTTTPIPAGTVASSLSRVRSDGGVKKRAKRQLVITKDAVFRDNDTSVFVVHVPTKEGKINVTPNDIQEVVLDPSQNKPGSFLYELAFNGLAYSSDRHAADCDREESYLFTATSAKRPTRYHVSFSHAHPEGFVQIVDPADDITLSQPLLPATFVNFLPTTVVVFPSHVIGSASTDEASERSMGSDSLHAQFVELPSSNWSQGGRKRARQDFSLEHNPPRSKPDHESFAEDLDHYLRPLEELLDEWRSACTLSPGLADRTLATLRNRDGGERPSTTRWMLLDMLLQRASLSPTPPQMPPSPPESGGADDHRFPQQPPHLAYAMPPPPHVYGAQPFAPTTFIRQQPPTGPLPRNTSEVFVLHNHDLQSRYPNDSLEKSVRELRVVETSTGMKNAEGVPTTLLTFTAMHKDEEKALPGDEGPSHYFAILDGENLATLEQDGKQAEGSTIFRLGPGEFVLTPGITFGSSLWWRQQECVADKENLRRRARILHHFATCLCGDASPSMRAFALSLQTASQDRRSSVASD